jgi:uncharacterized membrane protein YgaE (UPF0421/DUF939 family)
MKFILSTLPANTMFAFGIVVGIVCYTHQQLLQLPNWAALALLATVAFFGYRSYNNEDRHKSAIIVTVFCTIGAGIGLYMLWANHFNAVYLAGMIAAYALLLTWNLAPTTVPGWEEFVPDTLSIMEDATEQPEPEPAA